MERVSIILLISNPSDNHSATKRSTLQLDADCQTENNQPTIQHAQLSQRLVAGRHYNVSIYIHDVGGATDALDNKIVQVNEKIRNQLS